MSLPKIPAGIRRVYQKNPSGPTQGLVNILYNKRKFKHRISVLNLQCEIKSALDHHNSGSQEVEFQYLFEIEKVKI